MNLEGVLERSSPATKKRAGGKKVEAAWVYEATMMEAGTEGPKRGWDGVDYHSKIRPKNQ